MSLRLSLLPKSNTVDAEEEMLYGDSGPPSIPKDDASYAASAARHSGKGVHGKKEPTHWCIVVRENGVMEVKTDMN